MKNYPIIVKQMIVLSLFIIVPIITITFIFNYGIMKYSEDEIGRSGLGKLDAAENITDLMAQTISNDSVHLSLNETLNRLYGIDDITAAIKSSDNNLMLYQFVSMLSDIVKTNNAYSSVYLYLDNSNYIATSNGVYFKDNFPDSTWVKTYLSSKELNKPISWTNPRPSDTNGNNYVLSYIYPMTYTTNLKGSIAINIYENKLSTLINSNNYDISDFISIINSKGEVISSVDKTQLAKNISDVPYISKILGSKQNRGHFIDRINGKRYLITYLKTTGADKWTYVGVFSLNTLTNKVNSLKISIIYISICLLVLFVLLSYVISRKLYNPVKKLVQEIKQRKGVDIIGDGNEFTLLAKTFDTMIRQEDQLFRTLEKDQKNLRENYLLSLLRGKPSTEEGQIELFTLKNLMCCVLYIDKYNDFISNFSYEQQYYLKTVILNLCEEKIGESFICSGVVLDGDKIVLVVNFADEDMINVTSILKNDFSVIQQEAAKVIETTITVCLGGFYNDILKIRNSYIEAQNLLKQRFMLGHQAFIYQLEDNSDNNKYFYPFNIEKQILNNVDIGSKDALLTSISSFFDEVKQNKSLSYDSVMLILNQLVGSTIKYLLDLNISVSKIFGSDFNIYSKLAEINTLDEAGLFLSNIYLQIIEYNEKFKVEGKSHILKIMDYIHKNYKKDIAINTLAEHVGLSYSHVRKIFNDETGENIVNYINNMRIEEAQRLLRQTNMNINDIALSLGYNNKQSFNRFFKKYVGINPGEYRSIKAN